MVNKFELAQYLVNLHSLMLAQQQTGGNLASTTLAAEYEANWDLLKDTITKENEVETRKRSNNDKRDETRTDLTRDQSGRREPDRLGARNPT